MYEEERENKKLQAKVSNKNTYVAYLLVQMCIC